MNPISHRGGCLRVNMWFISAQFVKTGGWLRIFGRGFAVKDTNKVPLLFSERNGHIKTIRIGKWSFKYLPA